MSAAFRLAFLLAGLSLCACQAPGPSSRQALAPAAGASVAPLAGRPTAPVESVERAAPLDTAPFDTAPFDTAPLDTAPLDAARQTPRASTAPTANIARPTAPLRRAVVAEAEPVAQEPRGPYEGPRGYALEPVDYDRYLDQRFERSRRPTAFPINTAVGAGIGAVIGNQRGRSRQGAWIGAGVGLLFDLGRWARW